MTLRPPNETYTVGVTDTARDKEYRMYTDDQLEEAIRSSRGEFWKREEGKRGCEEYHQVYGPYVLVLQVDHEKHHITVITQMHTHIDYPNDWDFRHVDRVQDPRTDVCPFGNFGADGSSSDEEAGA